MSIFNSLGSNYDFRFVLQSLLATNNKNHNLKLVNFLEEQYSGKAILVYKGREALRLALRAIDKRGGSVGVCGFTCFAVYEAVIKEGYKIEYLDIEKDRLNFGLKTFTEAYEKNPKLKVLVVQNTLGYSYEMEKIAKFCSEKGIVLIEDLAHSIGTKYNKGKIAGTIADFVALSFSQDKMIDGVAGGALIVKNSKFKIQNSGLKDVSLKQQNRDRFYPLFTYLIRKTYGFNLGKILHKFLKKIDLLSKPIDNIDLSLHKLPNWYCKAIYSEFKNLEKNLDHRKRIAKIYTELLDSKVLSKVVSSQISNSANLRFPIFVEDRNFLINFLKKNNIFISDIWYDAPIAPKKYLHKTDYRKGECPNSEMVAETILNLPTHKNVSEKDARFIAGKINLWLK